MTIDRTGSIIALWRSQSTVLAISDDGTLIATLSLQLEIIKTSDYSLVASIQEFSKSITCIAFSSDNRSIVMGFTSGYL